MFHLASDYIWCQRSTAVGTCCLQSLSSYVVLTTPLYYRRQASFLSQLLIAVVILLFRQEVVREHTNDIGATRRESVCLCVWEGESGRKRERKKERKKEKNN